MTSKDKDFLPKHGEIVIYTTDDKEALTINEHIQNVYEEKELDKSSTIRKSLIVQLEGQRRAERIFQ